MESLSSLDSYNISSRSAFLSSLGISECRSIPSLEQDLDQVLKHAFCSRYLKKVWRIDPFNIYWVTQKLPQICTVIFRIRIGKVAWFAVYICGNFWVTQYIVYSTLTSCSCSLYWVQINEQKIVERKFEKPNFCLWKSWAKLYLQTGILNSWSTSASWLAKPQKITVYIRR